MDALTPNGRDALDHAARALKAISDQTGVAFVPFPDSSPARVDGVIVGRSGGLAGIYEVKARNMSIEDLMGMYRGDWLLSYDKLCAARELAVSTATRFIGVLFCVPSNVALVQPIWGRDGSILTSMVVSQTMTQKTCNGGLASRANAYINMTKAARYDVPA